MFIFDKRADGKPLLAVSISPDAALYKPRSLDFYTSKYGSLYNRKHDGHGIDDGTDYGDSELHFFDSSGNELTIGESETPEDFQTRLTSNCIKTICCFENSNHIWIWGSIWSLINEPSGRAYLWCVVAPDIPEEYGGNFPFMAGGWNLQAVTPKQLIYIDAKACSEIQYNGETHQGKIALIIKHQVGDQIGVQMIYQYHEE